MPLIKPTALEKEYICKAADLGFGESLFVDCKTHKQQKSSYTQINNAAKEYCHFIDPSILLTVVKTFQDGKHWVKITKEKAPDHMFVLGADGRVRKEEK